MAQPGQDVTPRCNVDFSRIGFLCGELLYKKNLAFGTMEVLGVFVFFVLLVVLLEMSGGK
jgi:hypothetical protein